MRVYKLSPREKAIGKLFAIRESINIKFLKDNPQGWVTKDWGKYCELEEILDAKIQFLSETF